MRLAALLILVFTFAAPGAVRAGDRAGVFDYYVLSLSWSPAWCAAEGDARHAAQCDKGRQTGFVLHGLWPQFDRGWPQHCATRARDPSRGQTAAMADIMGSAGLAWHEWQKHGRCSGLSAADYFALARRAWGSIRRPEILRKVSKPLTVAPSVIEQAFLKANPDLSPEGVTVTCKDGAIREVRICLSKTLAPRACTGRTARDCPAPGAEFLPIR